MSGVLVGVALGFFIGLISGLDILMLLRAVIGSKASVRATMMATSQLLAVPTFCFGGPWISAVFLQSTDLNALLLPYSISLSITVTLTAGYPLLMFIIAFGNKVHRAGIRTL